MCIRDRSKVAQEFFKQTLTDMVKHGADLIRLDAFAYAVKTVSYTHLDVYKRQVRKMSSRLIPSSLMAA